MVVIDTTGGVERGGLQMCLLYQCTWGFCGFNDTGGLI